MNEKKRYDTKMKQYELLKLVLDRAERLLPIIPREKMVDSIFRRTRFNFQNFDWQTVLDVDDACFIIIMYALYDENADFWTDLKKDSNHEVA